MRLTFILISLIIISCTQTANRSLTAEQTKKIQGEIQSVIAQIRDATTHVDTIKLYEVFDFGNDFTYIETNGMFYQTDAYKQMVREFYGPLQSEIIEKGEEKYNYLSEDNVMWSYSGTLMANYKDDRQVKYQPFGMTMLFRKKDDKWKAVFLQESTQEVADSTKH